MKKRKLLALALAIATAVTTLAPNTGLLSALTVKATAPVTVHSGSYTVNSTNFDAKEIVRFEVSSPSVLHIAVLKNATLDNPTTANFATKVAAAGSSVVYNKASGISQNGSYNATAIGTYYTYYYYEGDSAVTAGSSVGVRLNVPASQTQNMGPYVAVAVTTTGDVTSVNPVEGFDNFTELAGDLISAASASVDSDEDLSHYVSSVTIEKNGKAKLTVIDVPEYDVYGEVEFNNVVTTNCVIEKLTLGLTIAPEVDAPVIDETNTTVTASTYTATLKMKANEGGHWGYVVTTEALDDVYFDWPATSNKPVMVTVPANKAIKSDTGEYTANEVKTIEITGLSSGTSYYVYAAFKDQYWNQSWVRKSFRTDSDSSSSSRSSGGSSGGSSGNTSTKTTTNSDGTKTTTTTTKQGTVTTTTATTTKKDGTKVVEKTSTDSKTGKVTETKTTTKTDGSKEEVKTVTNKDGSKSVTETDTAADKSQAIVQTEVTAAGDVTIVSSTVDTNGAKTSEATFTATDEDTVKITNIEVTGKTVTIPAAVSAAGDKYKVTRIGAGALKGNDKVTKVVIGKNIKAIGAKAFADTPKLKTIVLQGAKVKSIGKGAFDGINKNATIKIKGTAKQVKAVRKLIQKSGVAKTVKIKRTK